MIFYVTTRIPKSLKRLISRLMGDGDDDKDEDVSIRWPPGSEPPAPRPAPCVSADSTDTGGRIEILIYYHEDRRAAEVVRKYAEYTFSEAWGEEYAIDVSVGHSVPNDIRTGEEWWHYVDNLEDPAKDSNHLIGQFSDCRGGGTKSMCGGEKEVSVFHSDCIREYGFSENYGQLISQIHEIGHTLGLGHDDGGTISVGSTTFATPMKGNYGGADKWICRLHPDAKQKGPDMNHG